MEIALEENSVLFFEAAIFSLLPIYAVVTSRWCTISQTLAEAIKKRKVGIKLFSYHVAACASGIV